jgi:dTDP-4-amino-4,6-dideoxy-D-galactose acyltransferase
VAQAPAPGTFRLLDWDSAHFGLRIGRVMPARLDRDLLRQALAWANVSSIDCMYLLADSNDADTLRVVTGMGWRMVDIRVTLEAGLRDVAQSATRVRLAKTEDIPYLKQLASRSHTDSRFYADGNFPRAACDELFSTWIERSVLDRSFAGAVLIAQADRDQPSGYITCSVKEGTGNIGLIAVDETARRLGLGTQLLVESARWFAGQGAERVSVVTQGCNIPALRMYQRSGFRIESIQLWFHWWRVSACDGITPQ